MRFSFPGPGPRSRRTLPARNGPGRGTLCLRVLLALALAAFTTATAGAGDGSPAEPPLPTVASGRIERLEGVNWRPVPARPVDVWLPDGYPDQAPYAVLYLHDGQMLFDAEQTWNGQEWRADEVAGALIDSGATRPFIIVGIWNAGPARRAAEYFPQRAFDALDADARAGLLTASLDGARALFGEPPDADRYLRVLVDQLMPRIARDYRISPAREDTVVMGASMGGLISLYALAEYPDRFGGAAGLSTHWPGTAPDAGTAPGEAILAWLQSSFPAAGRHRLWLDHGTATLDAHYPPWQQRADAILRSKGYSERDWTTRVYPGAEHTEAAWAARLDAPLRFLLPPKADR